MIAPDGVAYGLTVFVETSCKEAAAAWELLVWHEQVKAERIGFVRVIEDDIWSTKERSISSGSRVRRSLCTALDVSISLFLVTHKGTFWNATARHRTDDLNLVACQDEQCQESRWHLG